MKKLSPSPWLLLLGCAALLALPLHADPFGDYWYQGKAEITSYDLEQARYGEVHPGHAVLIFVTEDFSKTKQVKLDRPSRAGDDRVGVLKLNFTKNFHTGIYPYSMMSSIFSPIEDAVSPLKITTTSQEWCGHTFAQLNRTAEGYQIQGNSYFESEGDESLTVANPLTEDGLWNTLRLAPELLPTGDIELIPGTMYLRLRHVPWGPRKASASLTPVEGSFGLMAYTLEYPDLGRTLTLHFEKSFPHRIQGWEEAYRSGDSTLTTRATLKKRILNDYWTRNSLADAALCKELGLD